MSVKKQFDIEHKDNESEEEANAHIELEMKQLIKRTLLFLGIALAFYIILFLLAGEYLLIAGSWFGEYLGLWGVFAYVFLVDTFIVPTTADVIFTITQEWEPVSLLAVMSIASISGGFVGYLIGRNLNHFKFVRDTTRNFRERGERIIKKFGVWAIVLAGLTPLPYSTISWIAGMLKLKPAHYLLGSLSRIPRLILYYLLIKGGIILLGN